MTASRSGRTDAELVARMAAGDESALAAAYDQHVDAVFGLALRYLGDRAAAEAVVQDVYLAAWQQAGQRPLGSGGLRGWLLELADTRTIDLQQATERRPRLVVVGGRDDGREAQVPGRLAAGSWAAVTGEGDARPRGGRPRTRELAVARTTLEAMPELDREALRLAYEEALTLAEIAERLRLPIAEVQARTRGALAALRRALDEAPGARDEAAGPEAGEPPGTDPRWLVTGRQDAAR
jgi:RNA polymerase sigma-70 factor (ECF subfamily)